MNDISSEIIGYIFAILFWYLPIILGSVMFFYLLKMAYDEYVLYFFKKQKIRKTEKNIVIILEKLTGCSYGNCSDVWSYFVKIFDCDFDNDAVKVLKLYKSVYFKKTKKKETIDSRVKVVSLLHEYISVSESLSMYINCDFFSEEVLISNLDNKIKKFKKFKKILFTILVNYITYEKEKLINIC